MTDQTEEELQKAADEAYVQGKLPKKIKIKRETQTIFSVRKDD